MVDTTTAWNNIAQTYVNSNFGSWGKTSYGLIFWKVTPVSKTLKCTVTLRLLAPQSGVTSDQSNICTSTFDSATLYYTHICKCSLGALGGTGSQSCSILVQVSGLSSYGYSYYYPTAKCT
jgi:hypothetical protein